MPEPEYIVVGSGAGGGPLAARLAERGHTVLLLEAGGDEEPWNYQVPVFHGLATEDEAMRLDHYVQHYADAERQRRDPKCEPDAPVVFYPRARTLGGCTAHYAMIIIRPHDSDWQTICDATGDPSWAPAAMHEYFARVERYHYADDKAGGHGHEGWLPTRFPDVFDLARDAIRAKDLSIGQIVLEAKRFGLGELPINLTDAPTGVELLRAKIDPNDLRVLQRRGTGLIGVPTAIDDRGRRAGTRERIRAAQATGRLEVRLHHHVTGLVFDERDPLRVVGVRYLRGERLYRADRRPGRFGTPAGPAEEVRATREVILAGGAFLTPQLLMLSGIGPRAALESLGIACRRDLPGVGENLQDRYEVGIVSQTKQPFGLLANATFEGPGPGTPEDPLFAQWREGRGLYASNGAVLGFIARSSVAEHGEPDLFIFGVPGAFVGYKTGWSRPSVEPPYNKWTWLLLKAHARFRGTVRLRRADPLDPPAVNFDYFPRDPTGTLTPAAQADLQAMRDGVQLVKRLLEGSRVAHDLHPEAMQGVDLDSETGIDTFVQDRAWGHHASCTCKIGGDDDPLAVLDASFRVRGVRQLRVVDASVFPKIPGFFVVMPTYMISEKAADAIHADAGGR